MTCFLLLLFFFFFDGGGRNILRGGKCGTRGREAGGEGEGSGGKGGGKRGLGTPCPPPPHYSLISNFFAYYSLISIKNSHYSLINKPHPDPRVSYDSVLNHFNLVNILSAKGPKRKPHTKQGGGFCIQFVHFYLSYVRTGSRLKHCV